MLYHNAKLHVLLNDDEESAEFRRVATHVECCEHCQQRLLQLSGDYKLIDEVRETLLACEDTTPYDFPSNLSSVVLTIEGNSDFYPGAECEPVSLDFLGPPSHPEMLGRIGRYEVERVIGTGGMGVVLKGFDTELHRVVAIKVLKSHLAHNGAARRRFAREAQSAAAVVHEHVIPIHDVSTDEDTPYLVMQYVPGQSLQARVDERGPLDAKEVLRIARQAAAGLAAAHAQGVVHRDVKPANILLEESVERVLISDFGLARTVDDATLTRTGVVAGTPHYMSPEQAAGKQIDQRSDLFSLGSSIYFMCTGRPPFRADHALAVLNRICNDDHRPVDEVNSDVPAELADIVDRLLSKQPADRFKDATEVEHRLEAVLVRLQNGQRFQRFRWRRSWIRWRRTVWRTAAGIALVAACVWIGFGLAEVGRDSTLAVPPVESPAMLPEPVAVVAAEPTSSPASRPLRLINVPRDTFAQDLAETQQLLNRLDSNWTAPSAPFSEFESEAAEWQRDLLQLQEDLGP